VARFCAIAGLILTTVGTVLAGWALWQDWRVHAGGEPLIPVLAKARRWLVMRVLRRPPGTHVVGKAVSTSWDVHATATGYVAPPSNAPVDVQMRFVRERIQALEATIAKQRQELDQRIDRVQSDSRKADAESRQAIADLTGTVRELATGSVRMELVGLVLVGVGSIVATAPAVFGW